MLLMSHGGGALFPPRHPAIDDVVNPRLGESMSSKQQQDTNQGHYHPNFDELLALAKDDPALFEAKRLEYIEYFFATIPAERQRRLRGLQWQIDQTRQLARTPMASCMNMMNMMWDSLNRLTDQQRALVKLTTEKLKTPVKLATYVKTIPGRTSESKIIPFPRH